MNFNRRRSRNSGFSLVELLGVMLILGLIVGIAAPQVLKRVSKARSDTAELQIEELGTALDLFNLENGRYPTSSEGLQALVAAPTGLQNWNGPYLKKATIPDDPWGKPYYYVEPGQHGYYDLYSLGADQAPGGESEDKDAVSWD
ncbi:MAG: type II secretion system major pseudopilin GspG [Gammaproteobacteria bacterium]|nr:type II secretion system major pseudopilin GspG [Gammaproteobacteria bacterium]